MNLQRNNYNNIWFTSDWHINHNRPFIYGARGFKNIKEHDEFIRDTFLSLVDENDIVFHMGDLFFDTVEASSKFYKSINVAPFHCIIGNHDRALNSLIDSGEYKQSLGVLKDISIQYDDTRESITLCHYPMLSWNKSHYGAWNLCGHSHGSLPDSLPDFKLGKRLDVCVDVALKYNKTFMFTFEDIKCIMDSKVITTHH
jgi:calcineurin-like phosphoesterase family protein